MSAADDVPPRVAGGGAAGIERPVPSNVETIWGSDVVAQMLRMLDLPYVALNPGASFRGLHDSLVNLLGNQHPQMLLCLHEENAVAIAHGWAKVTERPMAAIVHSNVGLMHATMAVFNAWCDRVPLLLIGATGPVDAAKRRPWIDWIHTAQDQAALVRPYTKWDDQPVSPEAAIESLLRANLLTRTQPCGPTYVIMDAGMQEMQLDAMPPLPDVRRFAPPRPPEPAPEVIEDAARRLLTARRPIILMGRVSRDAAAWQRRIALAEALGAVVLTDLKTAASFPTAHPAHRAPSGTFLSAAGAALLREADVVLSLDWIDLGGTLKAAYASRPPDATVIQVTLDQLIHNGWSMDHQGLPPADLTMLCNADTATQRLLEALKRLGGTAQSAWPAPAAPEAADPHPTEFITVPSLAATAARAVAGLEVCLIRGPLSWAGQLWRIEHPLDYLGIDGGAGVGSGPGMAVGAALALRGSGRLPLTIIGDGDFLMAGNALWTAVHYEIPLLLLVANNRSFYNDELHQERVARQRGRPVPNKWIGQHIGGPDLDIAMLARAQGAVGLGPIRRPEDLPAALAEALAAVQAGRVGVVDVHVQPGYDKNTTQAMLRQSKP
jgi:thiamine pyrophosphate-dependent acetolactate synthase large subunit-like protein